MGCAHRAETVSDRSTQHLHNIRKNKRKHATKQDRYGTVRTLPVLDNRNKKVGLAALRLIHLSCAWWRNVFGALLEKGFVEMKLDWVEWTHGYLRGREDCELVQRATGERLRAAGVAHTYDSEDMSNAFVCTASEERFWVDDEQVREREREIFLPQDASRQFDGTNNNVRRSGRSSVKFWALHGLG